LLFHSSPTSTFMTPIKYHQQLRAGQ
jgi:hypothetical protein